MSLKNIINTSNRKRELDDEAIKENVHNNLEEYRKLIAYWRVYPDKLVDFYLSLGNPYNFKFYFYQRLFLRALFRHKNVYATFVRAWSKSFMSVMALMLRCVLYPNAKIATVAGGKQQSAEIVSSKVQEICRLIPALEKEIIWDTRGTRARTAQTKDTVIYTFKNGSTLENIAASEKTRGRRFQAILAEECVGIDQDILNEVIIPTLNVDRMIQGKTDPNEQLNKSQIYVTTAGWKNTFSYDKLIQLFCQSVARPDEAIILGGSWRVPVVEGLLSKNFVRDLKMDGTFNEDSFDREYNSIWSGDVESAFFSSERFDKNRRINLPEWKYSNRTSKDGYYVMGVDVGRFGCSTEVIIIKVTPGAGTIPRKRIVNIYSFEEEHFGMQALQLKRLYQQYHCKVAVVDGNGLGAGLVDMLTMDTIDPDTGETLYNWGVMNDEDNKYRNMKTDDTVIDAMYIMKANQTLNSEMYSYCQAEINAGRVLFLIDEATAKNKLMAQAQGKKMSQSKRAEYLRPFVQTSILKDQMLNLITENEGANIILKQSSRTIKKDKFSALIYGLYYCKLAEDRARKKKKRDISKFMFFN